MIISVKTKYKYNPVEKIFLILNKIDLYFRNNYEEQRNNE